MLDMRTAIREQQLPLQRPVEEQIALQVARVEAKYIILRYNNHRD